MSVTVTSVVTSIVASVVTSVMSIAMASVVTTSMTPMMTLMSIMRLMHNSRIVVMVMDNFRMMVSMSVASMTVTMSSEVPVTNKSVTMAAVVSTVAMVIFCGGNFFAIAMTMMSMVSVVSMVSMTSMMDYAVTISMPTMTVAMSSMVTSMAMMIFGNDNFFTIAMTMMSMMAMVTMTFVMNDGVAVAMSTVTVTILTMNAVSSVTAEASLATCSKKRERVD